MKIIKPNQLAEAAECLRNGGLVAFPTETVYGLGANALNPIAVAGIFEAKQRPNFDPLIVHIADRSQLDVLFKHPIDPLVFQLAEKFMPGPLTIVHKKADIIPDLVTSGMENVAVRMPSHATAHKLIELAGVPVAAPSANKFGQLSPTSYKHVEKQNMDIDYIVADDDLGHLVGIESTVVMVENGTCTVLRPGIVTAENIEAALGIKVTVAAHNTKINSPGLLNSHYSPTKPLYFLQSDMTTLPVGSGLILHAKTEQNYGAARVIYTSENANLKEVAAHLFSSLHQMEDDERVTQIFIEAVPEQGVGMSIMDRLKKATYQYR